MPYVPWGNCRVFLITGTPWKLVGDEFRSKDNYELWTDTSYKHRGRIPKLKQEGAGEFWQLFSILFGIIILNTPAPQPGGIS